MAGLYTEHIMTFTRSSERNRSREKLVALFDIGSGSVHGALALLSGGDAGRARLIYGDDEEFIFHEHVNAERLSRAMLSALEKVADGLSAAAHEHHETIGHVMLTFSAPWCIAETKILHYEHDTQIEIKQTIIDSLIEEAWRRFGTTPSTDPEARGARAVEAPSVLIEQAIVRVALNGYRTQVPIGKVASTLEIALYLSRMPRGTLEDVHGVLERIMPGAALVPHSSALVLTSVLRDLFPVHEDFLLCHVSAEMTELVLVLEGVLLETISFPYGTHTLVRELASSLKSSPAATLSLLSLGAGAADEKTTGRTNDALHKRAEGWLTEFRRALASLTDTHGLMPGLCMILGENTLMTERFRQFLDGERVAPAYIGVGTFRPVMLTEQALGTRLTCEGNALPCLREISLACEALFARSDLLSTR